MAGFSAENGPFRRTGAALATWPPAGVIAMKRRAWDIRAAASEPEVLSALKACAIRRR
jgi:hypothetical protein